MKSLNPYCPRNQGVTPITNGGTGATTAEDALVALGGAKKEDLQTILGPFSDSNVWYPLFAPYNSNAFIMVSSCKFLKNVKVDIAYNGWQACEVQGQARNAGQILVIITPPSGVSLEPGNVYIARASFEIE